MEDTKQSEIETYDSPTASRPMHGSIWNDEHLNRLFDMGAESEFDRLISRYASSGNVIVLGCGGGRDLQTLSRKNSTGIVAGIEIATRPLKSAQNHTQDNANVQLCRGDAENLPYADGTFDAVVARALLHHLPNFESDGLAEITRILSDDGALIFFEPGKYNPPAAIRRRFFPTQSHTPDESPFDPDGLESVLEKYFESVSVEGYYVVSNLLPVLDNVLPSSIPASVTSVLYDMEQRIPGSRKLSWILVGKAEKPRPNPSG